MACFRICRTQYASELNGKGAAINGGRWNAIGTEMIYTADSPALAMAEVRAHLYSMNGAPEDYSLVTIQVPDEITQLVLAESSLPEKWNAYPAIEETQKLGDAFIAEGKSCILKVPSAIVKGCNFLINPNHPDFVAIKIKSIEPFIFNERLFQ